MLTLQERILKRARGLFTPLWLAVVFFCAGAALDVQAQAPPPNDNLTNAQIIAGTSGIVYGDNLNATIETNVVYGAVTTNEPTPYGGGASIWYLWTAPITTTMDFSTRYSTEVSGDELGTAMAVYPHNRHHQCLVYEPDCWRAIRLIRAPGMA